MNFYVKKVLGDIVDNKFSDETYFLFNNLEETGFCIVSLFNNSEKCRPKETSINQNNKRVSCDSFSFEELYHCVMKALNDM